MAAAKRKPAAKKPAAKKPAAKKSPAKPKAAPKKPPAKLPAAPKKPAAKTQEARESPRPRVRLRAINRSLRTAPKGVAAKPAAKPAAKKCGAAPGATGPDSPVFAQVAREEARRRGSRPPRRVQRSRPRRAKSPQKDGRRGPGEEAGREECGEAIRAESRMTHCRPNPHPADGPPRPRVFGTFESTSGRGGAGRDPSRRPVLGLGAALPVICRNAEGGTAPRPPHSPRATCRSERRRSGAG